MLLTASTPDRPAPMPSAPPLPPSPTTTAIGRRLEGAHLFQGARDFACESRLFRLDAGVGAWSIDEGHDGKLPTFREGEHATRLAKSRLASAARWRRRSRIPRTGRSQRMPPADRRSCRAPSRLPDRPILHDRHAARHNQEKCVAGSRGSMGGRLRAQLRRSPMRCDRRHAGRGALQR